MTQSKIAVVVIGYNRANNMMRLLESIKKANFLGDTVDLLISIDNSGTDAVEKAANEFVWQYGEKKVFTYPERMGLRNHIMHCGSFLEAYDALVVLEDDLVVSPAFYSYVKETVSKYTDDDRIAGISLYTHLWNHNAKFPFMPNPSQFDVFFLQMAQSWGQVWMKKQWADFFAWYKENQDFEAVDYFPDFMTNWSKSWLKFHNKYCVEKNKYFVYPYNSYSTCYSEAGEHSILGATNFQVPMQNERVSDYRFPTLDDESAVKYDIFYERKGLAKYLDLNEDDLVVDLYGTKTKMREKRKYLLSSRNYDYKVIRRFGLQMRPQEQNIIYNVDGNELFLYDTEQTEKKNGTDNLKSRYVYFHRIYGNTKLLAKVLLDKLKEDVYIRWMQRRKKR